jgi:hypothetical protein
MAARKIMSKQMQLKLLGTVVEFMARNGVTESAIRDSFNRGLANSRKLRQGAGSPYLDGSYMENSDVSADVLRLWHRDGRYIDDVDAKPRPLHPWRGRNSVRSLIHSINPNADARAVLAFMKSACLLRKSNDGRVLPATEGGTITQDDSFVVEHLVRSITRLFGTMRRNTSAAGRLHPLIERYAYVSDFNPSDSKAFAEFTSTQGLSYLQAVDDWMEQRRLHRVRTPKPSKGRGLVAGVQIVAYLGDRLGAGGGTMFERSPIISDTKSKSKSSPAGKSATPSPSTPS